jgi:simple sugar transport system substrate-binding protein
MGTSSKDAPGVSRAIEELGLKNKVFVAGTGLVSECAPYLKDGTLQFITLWDPKDAGYALCSLATKILRGEKIGNGLNLGLKGYENLQFAPNSSKVLVGSGWIVMNKDNMANYNF